MSTVLSYAYYSGSNAAAAKAFGVWRGRALDGSVIFMPYNAWSDIEGTTAWFTSYGKPAITTAGPQVCITLPLLPAASTGATLAIGNGGGYASHFTTFGTRAVSYGLGGAILRLGHEMNGNWYPWSGIGKHADFIANYQAAVTALRAVAGSSFKICWCPANGGGGGSTDSTPEGNYPGDSYVDYVAPDVYDFVYGVSGLTAAQHWNVLTAGNTAGTFSSGARGLNYWADFADTHSKPLAFPEWGLCNTVAEGGGGGGDSAAFIDNILTFIASRGGAQTTPGFESYFNSEPSGLHSMLASYSATTGLVTTTSEFPLASAEYQARMQNIPTPPDNPPPPPPTVFAPIGSGRNNSYYG